MWFKLFSVEERFDVFNPIVSKFTQNLLSSVCCLSVRVLFCESLWKSFGTLKPVNIRRLMSSNWQPKTNFLFSSAWRQRYCRPLNCYWKLSYVCLSPPVRPPVHPSTRPSACPPIRPFAHRSVRLSLRLSMRPSAWLTGWNVFLWQ